MINNYTPDKRPALAFDAEKEVQTIIDALNAYRYDHVDPHIAPNDVLYIKTLIDELEKVQILFTKTKGN